MEVSSLGRKSQRSLIVILGVALVSFLVLAGLGIIPLTLIPVTANLPSVADLSVSSSGTHRRTTNFVSVSSFSGTDDWAYFRFEVSSIPEGATITSARLKLYFWATMGTIDVYTATADWTEAYTTWSDKPSAGTLLGSVTAGNSWTNLDVTSQANSWRFEGVANYGFILKPRASTLTTISSREEGDATKRPYIQVTYTPAPPPPASTSITVSASPSTVSAGSPFNITGVTSSGAGEGLSGQVVYLKRLVTVTAGGYEEYDTPIEGLTGSGGAYRFTASSARGVPVEYTEKYRIFFDGAAGYSSSQSGLVTVTIRPAAATSTGISISTSPNPATLGASVTVSGALATGGGVTLPSKTVKLYSSTDGGATFSELATTTTDGSGRYSFTRVFSTGGAYTLKVKFLGEGTMAASERTGVLRVSTPTSLSLTADKTRVKVGESIAFTGQLTASGSGVSGRTVYLYRTPYAATPTWESVASTGISGDGSFSVTASPPGVGVYEFKITFPGDATYSPSESSKLRVNGEYGTGLTLTLNADRLSISPGQTVKFTGQLMSGTTPLSSKTVQLLRGPEGAGVGASIASALTTSDGYYTFTDSIPSFVEPSDFETYVYKVVFEGDATYDPIESATVGVAWNEEPVTPPPPSLRLPIPPFMMLGIGAAISAIAVVAVLIARRR